MYYTYLLNTNNTIYKLSFCKAEVDRNTFDWLLKLYKSDLFLLFQDVLAQTSASFNELVSPSCRKASEHTAAAALTELRNNGNSLQHFHLQQQPKHAAPPPQTVTIMSNPTAASSLVSSLLTKSHMNHLEANSVSVIPIDSLKPIRSAQSSPNHQLHANVTSSATSHTTKPFQMRSYSLKQHLETAAVLMDIGKKVIISPPSSNPQSPSVTDHHHHHHQHQTHHQLHTSTPNNHSISNNNNNNPQHLQSITSSVINIKRSASIEEIDLSLNKRQRSAGSSPLSNASSSATKEDKSALRRSLNPATDLSVIKRTDPYHQHHHSIDEEALSQHSNDNSNDSSDPGRLQMDINSQEAHDAASDDVKPFLGGRGFFQGNNQAHRNTQRQQQVIVDSGRETPDSMKSEDHATDPATTQLWQALARTTVNGGSEATHLLRQMINCRSLGLSMPSSMVISGSSDATNEPMSLTKVC